MTFVRLQPRSARARRLDTFYNTLTGLNTGRDRKTASRLGLARRFTWNEIENFYAANGIFAKIVDELPDDMTREWITFTSDENVTLAQAVLKKLRDLKALERYNWAARLARMHGGGVVVLGVDDGQDFDQPIDRTRVRAVRFLRALNRWRVYPLYDQLTQDVNDANFGEPEYYRIASGAEGFIAGAIVHHSRIHRFDGVKLPEREALRNLGWGDSIAVRLYDAIRNYDTSHDAAATIVDDFTQAVYKLKGLADMLESNSDDDVDALEARLMNLDKMRSIIRALIMDEDESFQKLSTTVTGLDSLIMATERRLTALSRMPHTKLLGESPGASLGEGGSAQERAWYAYVSTQQENQLRSPLEDLIDLILISRDGPTAGTAPKIWSMGFKPLFQLTEEEQAQTRYLQAQTDDLYIKNTTLYPQEVAKSRFGGTGYSTDTVLDVQMRDEDEEFLPDDELHAPPPDKKTNPAPSDLVPVAETVDGALTEV